MFHVDHDLLRLENVTRVLNQADASLVPLEFAHLCVSWPFVWISPGWQLPVLLVPKTNHDPNLKTERPVPGAEVGTRVLGRRPSPRRWVRRGRRRRDCGTSKGTESASEVCVTRRAWNP